MPATASFSLHGYQYCPHPALIADRASPPNGMESEDNVAQWHTVLSGSSLMTFPRPKGPAANSGLHPPKGGTPSNPYTLPHHDHPIVILSSSEEPAYAPFLFRPLIQAYPAKYFVFLYINFSLPLSDPILPLHPA
ncbi:hypothetical protein N7468_010174 [Penicillium chermesinum]|uniref:Uncharacterized protein n=1 Tax=Penicillium chermesinum TaxID=63820 RepID=A0A9W9NC62_9EURO|nr:uncharacterized protein N7468_010174 [Penicillium chermesinum]KAJ5217166.1 hypothetical protein N7468_010174 [Penicillium chermesinum]